MNDQYQNGLIPREAKAKNYVFGRISDKRLYFLVGGIMFASMIGDFLNTSMQFFLFLALPGMIWILTSKDPTNPTRLFVEGLSSFILGAILPKHYISILGAGYKEQQTLKKREEIHDEEKQ